MRTWTARKTLNFENNEALAVECSADGATVFAGSSTSKIYAFDVASGSMTHRLAGHAWEVWQLERVTDDVMLSGSYDRTCSHDSAQSFSLSLSVSLCVCARVCVRACVRACLMCLMCVGADKIMAWSLDARTGFPMLKTLGAHKGAVHSLRTCNGIAVSGSGDKSIRLWGCKRGDL